MDKSSFFTGQPIFNQLLSLIPKGEVRRLARKYDSDRYCKTFRAFDHVVTMLYSSLHRCNSLREVITGMQACAGRLKHLGLVATPRRSTLADANQRRSCALFEELYHSLYHHHYGRLPDSLKRRSVENRLFIVDSTIITLLSGVMKSTGTFGLNGRKKGGIKAHVLLRAKDDLPCFTSLTHGTAGDSAVLPQLRLPKGSILVMDKAYRSFKQFSAWTKRGVTWISRLHGRTVYQPLQERPLSEQDQQHGVLSDVLIGMGNPKTAYINPVEQVRLIVFIDPATNRQLEFITNDLKLSASMIAQLYKKRWQIEVFFKRIKQHFQLHFFLGDNENAIRIQVWCALIADLLIKIIKDRVDRKKRWSLANLSGLIRLHLGTYINLYKFLCNPEKALLNYEDPGTRMQLQLSFNPIRGA
jgi:hypothetical protein